MFKKQEPSDQTPSTNTQANSFQSSTASSKTSAPTTTASIGPSITITGDISGKENLVIHGQLSGSVSLPDHILTVGKQGAIDADVKAKTVDIEGSVSGTVNASELVRVKPSGVVHGDIFAPRVVLEDGCQFRGGIDMKDPAPQVNMKAVPKANEEKKPAPTNNQASKA